MFDKPLDFANLSLEQRQKLDEQYEVQAEIAFRSIELYAHKRKVVQDPSEENTAALDEYMDTFVRPLLRKLGDLQESTKGEVFSRDKLMSMLPMILTIVNQVVDLRMFIELSGFDMLFPESITKMIETAMNSDMPPG